MLEDVSPLLPRDGLGVREAMLAVASRLTSILRREWPVLAHGTSRRILRPQGEQSKWGALQWPATPTIRLQNTGAD